MLLAALAGPANAQEADAPQADPPEIVQPQDVELEHGVATWYGAKFHGRRTSNGERFNMNEMTAAHPTLPFGTKVLVRNIANGKEVVVRINDRLPGLRGRIIDLSRAAATALGILKAGAAQVVLVER
nr:septal ring lytic transglycosylase RlpA family protein [Ramlibacter agri]